MDTIITDIISRYNELSSQVNSPEAIKDIKAYTKTSKEISDITPLYTLAQEYLKLKTEYNDIQLLIKNTSISEEIKYFENESNIIKQTLSELKEKILAANKKQDPNDNRNAILEVRAGTGGEEASLFAYDLYKMYLKYAENQNFIIEQLSLSESEQGGIKEAIAKISGKNVYGLLKYENGVHRVQRVPITESSGRIHTSSASVVILPEVEDDEIEIKEDSLKIDIYRAGGPGGQGVNTTDSAVRITHIPTGIVVTCQNERSQLKNKERALKVLKSKLFEADRVKKHEETAQKRHDIIGSGDRSDKIRTYNFPQSRITDHRTKQSWFNLSDILNGNIDTMITDIKEKIEQNNEN